VAIRVDVVTGSHRFSGDTCLRGHFAARRRRGFSLVEVVIALAVISSAFLVVFGLLGVGLNSFHQSKAITVSSEIAQQVYSQLESIQFANLVGTNDGLPSSRGATLANPPAPTHHTYFYSANGGTLINSPLYFDEQGKELNTPSGAVYWVNVDILYPTPLTSTSTTVSNVDLATILVQVAYNPGAVMPAYDATTSAQWTGLTSTGATMQIANYQFYVNRNS
jgi:prepilin-type N-terminal cleavage/methylation domain-containing protein